MHQFWLHEVLCTIRFTTMTSIKIFSSQLHEQIIDFRLNFEHRAAQYDSNIETYETLKNQLSSQAFHIRIMTLKRENDVQKQKIARLRTRRNDYRQKSHQLKRKMIALRTHFEVIQIALRKQQHNDSIAYDSNAKEQSRKSNILRFDSHFFNRTMNSSSFFVIFVSSISERSLLFYVDTSHAFHIKYLNINDFYDDREKWEQWKKNLLTKIWTCSLQFFIEQHKINYARRSTKTIAYDIIKIRTRIDFSNSYITFDELLKNLNESFDDNENIKRDKVHNKLFDFEFRMIEDKTFEIFIVRYIVAIAELQYANHILTSLFEIFFKKKFANWSSKLESNLIRLRNYSKFQWFRTRFAILSILHLNSICIQ